VAGKIRKTDAQWRQELTPKQYRVTRQKGTERPFTGKYWNTDEKGVYRCVCCGTPLFDSRAKYDAGCGWPSFTAPVYGQAIREQDDPSLFMRRTEVLCDACDAHLGHVFPDGPGPKGLRYCINSASLRLDRSAEQGEEG
jgi:peptide-methionine (R)-S-oxide reductase